MNWWRTLKGAKSRKGIDGGRTGEGGRGWRVMKGEERREG